MATIDVAWVEDHVIDFYASPQFPASLFNSDTDVRKAFHYNDTNWAQLANEFTRLPWMKQIGVTLVEDDMKKRKTIGDLTTLIWNKYQKTKKSSGTKAGSPSKKRG